MTDIFDGFEVISVYSLKQAEEDGVLINIDSHAPMCFSGCLISHVTSNLLSQGYWNKPTKNILDRTLNIPNVVDLVSQSIALVKKANRVDRFFSGEVEFPSGSKQKVFIVQNVTGKFTVMLPMDY